MAYNYYVYPSPSASQSQTDLTAEMHKYYLEDLKLGRRCGDSFIVSHYPSLKARFVSTEGNDLIASRYGALTDLLLLGLDNLHGVIRVHSAGVHVANICKEQATALVNHEGCKVCGHPGSFVRLALMCPEHGLIGGL